MIEASSREGVNEAGGQLRARRGRLFGVLEQIDDKPLARRRVWEANASQQVRTSPKREPACALAVVDERVGEQRRRSEPQRIPARRPGEHKGSVVEKRPHQRFVRRRHGAETTLLRRGEQTLCKGHQLARCNEALGQAGGVGRPAGEIAGAMRKVGRSRRFLDRPAPPPQLPILDLIGSQEPSTYEAPSPDVDAMPELVTLERSVQTYRAASQADNTRLAYGKQWDAFAAWCPLHAAPCTR